mgnify:CR=1 FL=1
MLFRSNFGLTEEQARAEIAAETERWRKLIDPSIGEPWPEEPGVVERLPEGMTRQWGTDAPEGSGCLTVEQWAAANRTMQAQQGGPDEADQDRR